MLRKLAAAGAAVTALASAGSAQADVFYLNYEAPGVENTTAQFTVMGVTTFDSRTSLVPFTTHFHTGTAITAQYSAVQIKPADQYGGAGGTGKYAVAFADTPYSLHFTYDPTVLPKGVNYFGYWLSALDAGNRVAFYRAGVQVGSLSPADVLASIGGNRYYFGNPNAQFHGQDSAEPFAFINFYDTTGSFDEVRFSQVGGGGYESDNHTVGYYIATGGVPEPATWVLLVAGFGLVGVGLRRGKAALSDGFGCSGRPTRRPGWRESARS